MQKLEHPSVLSLEDLLPKLEKARAEGKVIVFTNGCFDILHPGHADLLERCKAQGDVLVVGVNSDASVARLGKGPGRPLNTFESRAFLLAHLRSVDYVVGFDEDTPLNLIKAIVPDVLIKGGDWQTDRIVGRCVVEGHGGRVLSLALLPGYSTTGLVERIRSMR